MIQPIKIIAGLISKFSLYTLGWPLAKEYKPESWPLKHVVVLQSLFAKYASFIFDHSLIYSICAFSCPFSICFVDLCS